MSQQDTANQPSDALVFFGATGDLAYKQIFPALQALVKDGRLDVPIVGVAKAGWGLDQLRERARDSIAHDGGIDEAALAKLLSLLRYVDGDYRDPDTFQRLRAELGAAQRPLHYLAIPPSMFAVVAEGLARSGAGENARLVVEKPFGRDLASARELSATLHRHFPESAIFRIDHFLGKEAVQNIVYFRFANTFLEPIWNRHHVRSVKLTMSEAFGVEDRGAFYEEAGAIRDVVQNHLLQVIALLAMEPPSGHDPAAIQDERTQLHKAIRPLQPSDVVRGQYRGYRNVKGVAPDSSVETYVALRMQIDSWRWAGVPFFIRTGKCLPVTNTEVEVELQRPPQVVFEEVQRGRPNAIHMAVGHDIGIAVDARVKAPGEGMAGEDVRLIATKRHVQEMSPYERLLGDALEGDHTLFTTQEGVEAAWRVFENVIGADMPVFPYDPGTWGPSEADRLVAHAGGWPRPVFPEAGG
ncbi:MAG: glucose-6-phosphate dehydrogenase [Chloroflexi bacterium]|nr:glucose-6-phosphate dehydrogenase [Chloroflexota bacterium]